MKLVTRLLPMAHRSKKIAHGAGRDPRSDKKSKNIYLPNGKLYKFQFQQDGQADTSW